MLGIARRVIADPAPQASSETPVAEVADVADVADGGEMEQQSVTKLNLQAAMKQLTERDRELLALRYGADLSAAQIAEVLGQRTNAVEVALHRALQRLRGILDPHAADEI